MKTKARQCTRQTTIGVIMPMFSGFYMGEISATFRQKAKQHGVNLIMIRAGDSRDFTLPIALTQLSALIVVQHCAGTSYVKAATELGIPVFSMGASYAPLPVEQLCSDQISGVEQLYDWLLALGHRNIGFCGDLSVNDIRSRFNAFKQRVDTQRGEGFHSSQLYCVDSCSLSAGRKAASDWLNTVGNECTAIICATDENAIGMIEQLQRNGIRVPDDVAVVGIDNIFSGMSVTPALTTVDQQLEELACKAFERALARIAGAPFQEEVIHVEQKLVVRQSCGNRASVADASDASQSVRQAMVYESRYSSSELFDTLYSIAKDGFDSILDACSLYQCNLAWAELNRYDGDALSLLKVSFLEQQALQSRPANSALRTLSDLPCVAGDRPYVVSVLPVHRGERDCWDIVTAVENLDGRQYIGKSALFYNYLDILSLFVERDALIETSVQRHKKSQQLLQQLKVVLNSSNDGIWQWDLLANRLSWNGRLTKMLKLADTSDAINPQVLLNRVHPDDRPAFEEMLQTYLDVSEPFKCILRLRRDDGHYIWVQLSGAVIHNTQGRPIRLVGSMTDITEQQESADKIHQMAYYDGLTGVANRRKLMEVIEHHIQQYPNSTKAVMMMDLNRFKIINDTFGHQVGDALLCHVAEALQQTLRAEDIIGRFGGDEFVFFCDVQNDYQAHELANRLLRAVKRPMQYDNMELVGEASIGVAFYPQHGVDGDELIKNADVAMYRAKQLGGGEVVLFNSNMHEPFKTHLRIEHLLGLAIDQGEIQVHYQPVFSRQHDHIIAVEVLARWHSATLGQVNPSEFIVVAENSFLIMKLGDYIIDRVCQDVKTSPWLQNLQHISVNVSARQLGHSRFADNLAQKVNDYGLPASLFCLEMTETAAMADKEQCLRTLIALKNAGFTLSLDDFGTGFSSLSLLKRLPISEVKIDRSFIADIEAHPANLSFVKGLISMVQSLGHRVVAEGVETESQTQLLRALGVDLMQGFYLARPASLREFEQRFADTEAREKEET
ncbi:EAL domain-containing protein [Vibrio furnissii]|uniref:EAL domain-containing protein n=1 Tax=Vibrio furnissii TaxID=29494 RepID=UPI00257420D8|nr:EAL domain-containing protein [Vibrio furnissii]WJG29097.1 EAL domain-containing protein [Vibrio furnissii]